jgi:hypothetical protein
MLSCLSILVILSVPGSESRDRDVILGGEQLILGKPQGVGNLEWGGTGEGLRKGRSVHEQPGAKVDGIAPHKGRDSK